MGSSPFDTNALPKIAIGYERTIDGYCYGIAYSRIFRKMNSMTHHLAILAVLDAGACTTAMNWRFSYQLGTTDWDSYTWALFSVALDVAKWLMLPCAVLAWKFRKSQSIAAVSIWLVATIYSFTAAIGLAASQGVV